MTEGILTGWRLMLIAWTVVVVVFAVAQGTSILGPLFVWFIGLLVIGGIRAAMGSAFRR